MNCCSRGISYLDADLLPISDEIYGIDDSTAIVQRRKQSNPATNFRQSGSKPGTESGSESGFKSGSLVEGRNRFHRVQDGDFGRWRHSARVDVVGRNVIVVVVININIIMVVFVNGVVRVDVLVDGMTVKKK